MRLTALRVVRLPGIEAEFGLDSLDPGVNVITGPNASGKSSVLRALRALLYPEEARGQGVVVEGEFEEEGGEIAIQRVGDTISWQRDGKATEAPELPEARFLSCYAISIEELSGTVEGDAEISRRIARELSGGYDLAAARLDPAFNPKKAGQNEKKALVNARQALTRAKQGGEDLRRQERYLEGAERRKAEAKVALQELELVDSALELIDGRGRLQRIEARIAELPPGMELLRGDELQRLDALLGSRDSLKRDINGLTRSREEAERKLRDSGMAESDLDMEGLAEARSILGELRSIEPEIESCFEAEAKAVVAATESAGLLGHPVHQGEPPQVPTPSDLSSAEQALEEKRKLDAELAAASARLGELPDENEDGELPTVERLREARRELTGWLATSGVSVGRRLLASLLLLMGCAGFALPWLTAGAPLAGLMPLGQDLETPWALAAAAAFITGLLLTIVPGGSRHRHRGAFGRTGVRGPDRWRRAAVQSRLDRLGEEIAAAEARERELAERRRLERTVRSLGEQREREVERLSLQAERFGVDPLILDGSFGHWLGLVRDLARSRREAGDARAKRERLEQHWLERLRPLLALLARHRAAGLLEPLAAEAGEGEPSFRKLGGQLDALLGALEKRLLQRDEALAAIDAAKREAARLEKEYEAKGTDVGLLLEGAGLGGEETAVAQRKLELRTEQLQVWKEFDEQRGERAWRINDCLSVLEGREDLLDLAERGDEVELRRRREGLQRVADEHDDLVAHISRVEERLRAATEDRALEKAVAAEQLARDELGQRLDEALFAEAGRFMLDQVQAEYNQASRPEGLEQATAYFRRFTRNRYSLEFAAASQQFAARENDTGEFRSLEELSTGTRAQLLLAVRVAFAQQVERGKLSLPLFLDEALTTADAERFAAVAESLGLLVEDGRQIFYLSARREDAAYWAAGGVQPKVIDIAELRKLAAAAPPTSLALPARAPVPSPDGLSPEQYARELSVPPVNPWAEPEAIHLFHLLRDDLRLMRELLSLGVERLGSLESYLGSSELSLMATLEEERRLLLRCRAARAWIAGWRSGRGRPLTRQALVDSGAVSEKFIGRVDELRRRVDGDARRLLAGLRDKRVKGFQNAKAEDLEEWLLERGYIDERPRMGDEELSRRVIEAVARYAEELDGVRSSGAEREGTRQIAADAVSADSGPASRIAHTAALIQASLLCEFLRVGVEAGAVAA